MTWPNNALNNKKMSPTPSRPLQQFSTLLIFQCQVNSQSNSILGETCRGIHCWLRAQSPYRVLKPQWTPLSEWETLAGRGSNWLSQSLGLYQHGLAHLKTRRELMRVFSQVYPGHTMVLYCLSFEAKKHPKLSTRCLFKLQTQKCKLVVMFWL